MKILVFAKKKKTKEGREFSIFVTRLKAKTGEEVPVSLKFREDCGSPKADECPMYIEVDKKDMNFTEKEIEYTDPDTQEVKYGTSKSVWIKDWAKSPEEYVDTSMDQFED